MLVCLCGEGTGQDRTGQDSFPLGLNSVFRLGNSQVNQCPPTPHETVSNCILKGDSVSNRVQ